MLDTGAPVTVLRIPVSSESIAIDAEGHALLQSLTVHGVEFGPLRVRVKKVGSLERPEIYLGASEMRHRCLTMDYTRGLASFSLHRHGAEDLFEVGARNVENGLAECGLGEVPIRESLLLRSVEIGGVMARNWKFFLAGQDYFGGSTMTLEDGIIGTGEIASWHRGVQIIDFLSGRFVLA